LAMEDDRILWIVKRTSCLRSGASRQRGLETVPAHSQVPVKERTQRFMVKKRTSRVQTLRIDHYRLICVELTDVRRSS
jgi:hypothetical protein